MKINLKQIIKDSIKNTTVLVLTLIALLIGSKLGNIYYSYRDFRSEWISDNGKIEWNEMLHRTNTNEFTSFVYYSVYGED